MKLKIKTFLKRIIPEKIQKTKAFKMAAQYKYMAVSTLAVFLCLCITLTTVVVARSDNEQEFTAQASSVISFEYVSSEISSADVSTPTESLISSEESSLAEASSAYVSSKKSSNSKKKKTSSSKNNTSSASVSKPASKGDYQYNTNLNIEDNVFMDSLIYTGYNMEKHRADGKMWTYVLAKYKRGYGWLSNITYAGGSTGYETKNGKPDIGYFEKNGFVCASFATYVYFNYLPNVAGIDTSSLPRPENSKLADSWYKAVQQWVKKGYSRTIDFTAKKDSSNYIVFNPKETIPIGSIIIFRPYSSNQKIGSHVVVYAGYKNGFHWVYHVGTKNGPEMCAVERMLYGPEPQWPMMVVTTPSNIRMAAMLEVELKDDEGKSISGVEFSLKNTETGTVTKLGKTDKNGKITKECLNYGEYTLIQTSVPKGYTAKTTNTKINLTTKNNSKNTVKVVNVKNKPAVTSTPVSSSAPSVSSDNSTQSESSKNGSVTSELAVSSRE